MSGSGGAELKMHAIFFVQSGPARTRTLIGPQHEQYD